MYVETNQGHQRVVEYELPAFFGAFRLSVPFHLVIHATRSPIDIDFHPRLDIPPALVKRFSVFGIAKPISSTYVLVEQRSEAGNQICFVGKQMLAADMSGDGRSKGYADVIERIVRVHERGYMDEQVEVGTDC